MLLNFILTIITFRTFPGLNKLLNETISTNYGSTNIETKMNYIIYTRIAAIVLLLTGIVSGQVLVLPCIGEGISIYNGLLNLFGALLLISSLDFNYLILTFFIILKRNSTLPCLSLSLFQNYNYNDNHSIKLKKLPLKFFIRQAAYKKKNMNYSEIYLIHYIKLKLPPLRGNLS